MPTTAIESASLRSLVAAWPHHPYRHLRVKEPQVVDYLLREVGRLVEAGGAVFSAPAAGEPVAGAAVEPLPWDTTHFGIPMARLTYFITKAGATPDTLADLMGQVMAWCRQHGVRHLSARVDVGDPSAAQALEAAGFRLMDTSVYSLFHPGRTELPVIKTLGVIRPLEPGDDLEPLIAFARTGFRMFRFHADPHLPQDRSDELYAVWVRNLAKSAKVLVNVQHDQVVGFAPAFLHQAESDGLGLRIGEVGTTVILPTARGVYPGLLRAALEALAPETDVIEVLTSVRNLPVIKTWARLGLEPSRMQWVLHGWFGD